ncbi:hypothetical protein SDC9_202871 [bioreactor metagenome]|uniref:Uncharacterized protein n=1 Tax=bioreactor metagenome TaxID=1076179 RepID=A0A645IWE0_9ZZZZ
MPFSPFAQSKNGREGRFGFAGLCAALTSALLFVTLLAVPAAAQTFPQLTGRVVDQAGLLAEVQRWQDNAHLEWSEDDFADVAHYLNLHHYHFPAAD